MPDDLEVTVTPTTYTVTAIPPDLTHPELHLWAVTVEYRSSGRYAVLHLGRCLTRTGKWEYEGSPSGRTTGFRARTRFPLEEALALAKQQAPHTCVNGFTVPAIIERHRKDTNGTSP